MPRRRAALITKLTGRVFKRWLRVTKTIAAVRAGELAVDKKGDAGLAGAGTGLVRRKNPRGRRGDNKSFAFFKKTKRDADRFVLCGKERSFAVERINQNPPESCGGKREKMTAAHIGECSRGTEPRHVREYSSSAVL